MKLYTLTVLLLFLMPCSIPEAVDFLAFSPKGNNGQKLHTNKPRVANIIFKSSDGGQSWQDISEGLPQDLLSVGFEREGFFATERGLYLHAGSDVYLSTPNATAPFWNKQISSRGCSSMAPTKGSIYAHNYADSQFLQKIGIASVWLPMYTKFEEKALHTLFETARGTAFIRSDKGLFKSTNGGKTWNQAYAGERITKVVESNGILMATTQQGIVRSTDEGESWELVLSEGGIGIAVESIKGGFAAITYNTESKTRRVRTSYDGGKSWQPIDAGLPASLSIASIVEVGDSFFCGHPGGIYRSADKGKTWKLLFASMENKVFNLLVSGKVIYAIPREGGC